MSIQPVHYQILHNIGVLLVIGFSSACDISSLFSCWTGFKTVPKLMLSSCWRNYGFRLPTRASTKYDIDVWVLFLSLKLFLLDFFIFICERLRKRVLGIPSSIMKVWSVNFMLFFSRLIPVYVRFETQIESVGNFILYGRSSYVHFSHLFWGLFKLWFSLRSLDQGYFSRRG